MNRSSILVAALALVAASAGAEDARISTLLITGEHNHDWQHTSQEIAAILEATGRFSVERCVDPKQRLGALADPTSIELIVLDTNGPRWGEDIEARFLQCLEAGCGLVVIHAANNSFAGWKAYESLIGYDWSDASGHGAFHRFDVDVCDPDHPIMLGQAPLVAHPDELYHALVPAPDAGFKVLMSAWSDPAQGGSGRVEPLVIVREPEGGGRVFHTTLGHVWPGNEVTRASLADPALRLLIARGAQWAATGESTIAAQSFGLASPPLLRHNNLDDAERAAGWELLFDGTSTARWRGYRDESFPARGWIVKDGCLRHERGAGGGDIITRESFDDFELAFEWRVEPGGNSGVFYRVSEEGQSVWESGPEMQVLDDARHPDGKSPTSSAGALYGLVAASHSVVRPAGAWNQARILVQGTQVEHWLNGVRIVDVDLNSQAFRTLVAESKFKSLPAFARAPSGHIALQDHGDQVDYRTLRLRRLHPRR